MAERAARKAPALKSVPSTPARGRRAPVKAAEPVQPKPSVKGAAESGDDRETLVQLRNRIAETIDDRATPPRDLAALTRRMQEIVKDIKALDARSEEGGGAGRKPAPDESFDASAI